MHLSLRALLRAPPRWAVRGVAVQFRDGRRTVSEVWQGEVPDELLVREQGLCFWIQPKRNQNVGLFLDMGHIRQALASSMPGATVLNLFAYTCAFSVSALAHVALGCIALAISISVSLVGAAVSGDTSQW